MRARAKANKDTSFIEENHAYRMRSQAEQASQPWRGPIPQEVMQFWGYKFETLATLPAPWGETSREYIEGREQEVVNNKAQYCSVVRTGLGKTVLCLGGEVDAGKFAQSLSITEISRSSLQSQGIYIVPQQNHQT